MIIAYSLSVDGISVSVRLRGSGLWRVKINGEFLLEAFESAEEALLTACGICPLPNTFDAWSSEEEFHQSLAVASQQLTHLSL